MEAAQGRGALGTWCKLTGTSIAYQAVR